MSAPGRPLPVTESQSGLLVVDRTVTAKHLYNQLVEFEVDPGLDERTVLAALEDLLVVQPSFRLAFASLPEPHALLLEPAAAPLHLVDCGTCAPGDFERRRAAVLERLGTEPFDLARGPLYGVAYLRSAGGEHARILVCLHHIVTDGLSVQPLTRDLEALLSGSVSRREVESLRRRREGALERELAAQCRAAEQASDPAVVEQWAKELRDVPATVVYPRPERPAESSFEGRRLQWRLGPEESARLDEVCDGVPATPFEFFTAVYGAVLARFASLPQVIVGSPFMVRRTPGAYDLCGFFVNTLPIVVDVEWSSTLAEHVARTVAAVEAVRARSGIAFSRLVRALAPDRSTNRNPVFSCMLAMQGAADDEGGSALLSARELGNGTAKFDVWLGVTPCEGGWLLELEHDVELVPDGLAGEILGALGTALTRAVRDAGLRLRDLFDGDDRGDSYVTDGYGTAPAEPTVDMLLRARRPADLDRVAVEDAGGSLSYARLEEAVATAAAGLRRLGVRPGDVVGIQLDTLTQTVIALLAVLRAGAAYLPIDRTLPARRSATMVERARCRLVVGGDGVGPAPAVDLDALLAGGDVPGSGVAGTRAATGPVYVMFTSGSSGVPKGVQMGQRPLLNLIGWQIDALGMDAGTRFLQYAPLGFDVSFQEIFPTLACGGTVVSREPAARGDFPALVERVAEAGATHVYLPVAALAAFVRAAQASGHPLRTLRYLCVSGEQLRIDERVRAFFDERPGCVLVNLYGPTETHAVTTHRLRAQDGPWPSHVPIGLPLLGVVAHVVDASGHLAPRCVAGDLLLGGTCPADGYVGDPERTAESYVPDPFDPAGVVYRSGDRVLRDPDGVLVFLGREDDQVKIRGYRVELGEIESVAADLDGVQQAVAASRRTSAGDTELLLFVLAAPPQAPDPQALRDRLARTLPGYMVPARISLVTGVPTTANGKVDRPALVADAEQRITEELDRARGGDAGYADDLERELAELWGRVLDRPAPDAHGSLIAYGAHSLSVFTVLAEVGERYGVEVPIVEFFRTPTVSALAGMVRGTGG